MIVYLFGGLLGGTLLALSFVDLREFRLPDVLTFPLIGLGLLWSYLEGNIVPALIGAALGYSVFVAIAFAFKKLRGVDGLGRGDAKLLAAGGAWVTWSGLPQIVLIASLLGIAFALAARFKPVAKAAQNGGAPKDWIPFGPCLAVGIFAVWCAQQIA